MERGDKIRLKRKYMSTSGDLFHEGEICTVISFIPPLVSPPRKEELLEIESCGKTGMLFENEVIKLSELERKIDEVL